MVLEVVALCFSKLTSSGMMMMILMTVGFVVSKER